MAVEAPCGRLPLPVAFDERLERPHELAAVVPFAVLDRAEQRLAEEPQGVGVLKGEQQLEGAEVAVRREAAGTLTRAVPVRRARAKLASLERAAGLVVALSRAPDRDGPSGAGERPRPERLAHAGGQAIAELEELLVEEPGQQRDDEPAAGGGQPAHRLRAQGIAHGGLT